MQPFPPDVMIRQIGALADDIRRLARVFAERIHNDVEPPTGGFGRAYLVGDGDSHCASCAAEMAFASFAGLDARPMSALQFLEYGIESMRSTFRPALVVGISGSGATPRVLQALERARAAGAWTVGLTGAPASPITRIAHRAFALELANAERSPGIRTYQASLLGLYLLAMRPGLGGVAGAAETPATVEELLSVADAVELTGTTIRDACRGVAHEIAGAPVLLAAGSGPSLGTAMFAAAKVVEASGVFAAAVDTEEWFHVERLAYPADMPLFVIAPPGRSRWRSVELASAAAGMGRRVIAVCDASDTGFADAAQVVLPVHGATREEFSPMLYHVFAGYVASDLADVLGRQIFRTDCPASFKPHRG